MIKKKIRILAILLTILLSAININWPGVNKASADSNFSKMEEIAGHLKNGKNGLAISLAEKHLKQYPNDIAVTNLLTEAYIASGDLSTAEEIIKKALKVHPNNTWSHRLLAVIYRQEAEEEADFNNKETKLALASQQIDKGLAINPADVWLLVEATKIYLGKGEIAKANQTIDKALNIKPDNDYIKDLKNQISSKEEKTENKFFKWLKQKNQKTR